MKRFLLNIVGVMVLAIPASMAVQSCAITSQDADPVVAAQMADLEAQLAVAQADGDAAEAARIEAEMKELEARILRERAGPIIGAIGAIAPPLLPFSPLLMGLVPLLGRRGRKHAKNAVKAFVPVGKNPETGKKEFNMQFGEAVLDIGRYLGVLHSSKESEEVADGTATAVPNPPA